MWKIIATLKRKRGTTSEYFQRYYESNHVPLALAQLAGLAVDYRRNYVTQSFGYFAADASGHSDEQPEPAFDCVTEVSFADRTSLDKLLARMAVPENQRIIIADEEHFLDRNASRFMICEQPDGQATASI